MARPKGAGWPSAARARPYFVLFEALAPVVEVLGYELFPVFYLLGSPEAYRALFQALVLTGLALTSLSAYILLYHAYTPRRRTTW